MIPRGWTRPAAAIAATLACLGAPTVARAAVDGAAPASADPPAGEAAAGPPRRGDAAREGSEDEDRARAVSVGVMGGVGFPRPLALEGFVTFGRHLLLGAEYSLLPTTSFGNVDARSWAATGDARVFPFGGAFFVGLRAGFQRVATEGSVTVLSATYREASTVDAWIVNPRVGLLFRFEPFVVGIDAGLQIPVSATTTRTSSVDLAAFGIESPVASATDVLGRSVLPTVDLLRVGVAF